MSGPNELDRVLKSFFSNAVIDAEKGSLEIQGNRIVLLFAETLVATQKRMEALIGMDAAAMLLYESYKEAGRAACKIERNIIGATRGKTLQTIQSGLTFGDMFFWGKWEMSSFDKISTTFTVRDSAIVQFYGEAQRATCHQIRGVLAGFAETLVGRKRDCIEVRCKAKGDQCCEFVVASKENLPKLALERSEKR